ncbi:MAG: NAD(P)-binding protein [Proteobacteria bacterium]|nr:NAD(P)-binding protein [Pseudomonadota bacterium]
MASIETDYLIIGAGASGLAFADTLLDELPDAHITIVDRHGKPGGHWNDAYSFVSLHQPSAFYGVNSLPLGANRKDAVGTNQGYYELASGPEVSGYFNTVMNQKLLPSGRVAYHPMSDWQSEAGPAPGGHITSILSGARTAVTVRRKVVNAAYVSPSVPSTHTPKFTVGEGVRLVPPNALVQLWQARGDRPTQFVIVGAGKTAMDVGVWLLGCGASADAIQWVMPRDSWLINRATTQPGMEFFKHNIGGQAEQMDALSKATSVQDLFLRLEAAQQMFRIYPDQTPTMFHYATMSQGEVAQLRQITRVIRMGHLRAIEPTQMVLAQGTVPVAHGTLFIDCTASAVEPRPMQPIFQGGQIVLQLVRAPLPTFSAALTAYVEAHYPDDAVKNNLCQTVPFPNGVEGYPASVAVSMANQFKWSQDKALRQWVRNSRLDGFGKLIAEVDPADTEKLAILARFKQCAMAAMGNMPRLMGAAARQPG